MKALVILSHPKLDESIANTTIIDTLEAEVSDLEVRHIEKLYPDFQIDVEAEQAALLASDIVIFQHPFYWYSTPAGLKQWMDEVFSYGFAFGHTGDKLKGKHFLQSLTIGGPEESYTPLGYNHFTVDQLLKPMEQTVYLTEMVHHGFIQSHRNAYIEGAYNSRREVVAGAKKHARCVIDFIQDLRAGDEKKIERFIEHWFEAFDALDENSFFTQYLAADIQMNMAGADAISNIEGFNAWYDDAKSAFERPTKHTVSNLEISPAEHLDDHYQITFRAELNATLRSSQSQVRVLANERWLVAWDANSNRPTIKTYEVEVVDSNLSQEAA